MRQPAIAKTQRGRQFSQPTTIPAPTKGWNTRDPIANMDPGFATILDNWFPEISDLRVRKGYSQHVTGIIGHVESLMPYNATDGTQTLFAAANNSFYNVTSSGSVGAAVVSSLSNNKWYSTNFTNSSGTSYLCCFNGVDKPRYWNGSIWVSIDGSSSPAITGVTTTGLIYPFVHKRRMFIIEKDTLKLWYLPVDSVGGTANAFDLSGIADKGGYLVAGGTWTIDGGSGLDDYLVAVTSEGQIIVYSGTDPASNYTLVGVWNLGEPLGRRCLIKYGGDVAIMLTEGVFPLSKALTSGEVNREVSLSSSISPTFNQSAQEYKSAFGWQVIHFPKASMLLCNIPKLNNEIYAMNTITQAWCRFTDIDATCWAVSNGEIYFGSDGYVGKFWDTEADNGNNIRADMRHSFSYFGAMGVIKKINALRPNLLSNGTPQLLVGVNTDYQSQNLTGTLNFTVSGYGIWGTSTWGNAVWGGSVNSLGAWVSSSGTGIAIAPRMIIEMSGIETRYEAIDVLFETGTVIG